MRGRSLANSVPPSALTTFVIKLEYSLAFNDLQPSCTSVGKELPPHCAHSTEIITVLHISDRMM